MVLAPECFWQAFLLWSVQLWSFASSDFRSEIHEAELTRTTIQQSYIHFRELPNSIHTYVGQISQG